MRLLPCLLVGLVLTIVPALPAGDDGWIVVFNGKNLDGWKAKSDNYTITKFIDADGKDIKGAKKAKVDQKDVVVDAKSKEIKGAKVGKIDGKTAPVDADGKALVGAKITKVGGRDAIVNAKGEEIKDAKAIIVAVANPGGGWKVSNGELHCGQTAHGADLFTDKTFTDHEVYVEFQATSNSGVYLQGRYEIQVDNSFGIKPKLVEKDGKKVETLPNNMCGALYSRVAPSKNMAKQPKEWQSFHITFIAPRADDKGKVIKDGHLTLVWNGEKVIDKATITGATGGALDGKVGTPGPLMLQGDHGKVAYRNIKVRPLTK